LDLDAIVQGSREHAAKVFDSSPSKLIEGRWPRRLARVWAWRQIFLRVSASSVALRVADIVLCASLGIRKVIVEVVFELIATVAPLAWCWRTTQPPEATDRGIPDSIAFASPCHRTPRLVAYALLTGLVEMYCTLATTWAVAKVSCEKPIWQTILVYSVGVIVASVRIYSALLAVRVQDELTGACRRVLPSDVACGKDVADASKCAQPVTFGDIECDIDEAHNTCMNSKAESACWWTAPNGGVLRPRSPCAPGGMLSLEEHSFPPASPSLQSVGSSVQQPPLRNRGRRCCRRQDNGADSDVDQADSNHQQCNSRRLLLRAGLLLVVALATASAWIIHEVSQDAPEAKARPPSACATEQNATATCEPFETVGRRFWDHASGESHMSLADTVANCCSGCDALDDCQAWMFERAARQCRWIRFVDGACQENPGDLRCRCLSHHGTVFGFKPTTQVVWLKSSDV